MMATAARRVVVKKATVISKAECFHEAELSVVEQVLMKWAAWMRIPCDVRGYPSSSAGLRTGGQVSSSIDELFEGVDAAMVRAVDTIISKELTMPERLAVHNEWLDAVFRFREPQAVVYQRAVVGIERGLRRRGFWCGE